MFRKITFCLWALVAAGHGAQAGEFEITGSAGTRLTATEITRFQSPWALEFIDASHVLVTTKPGKLWLIGFDGSKTEIANVPKPQVGGQGGLGDVVAHPDFASNNLIYLSLVESVDGGRTRGAVVYRARLDQAAPRPRLLDIERIWTQTPKVRGEGHFSHRIAFGTDGVHKGKLFITSGDRQALNPAQDWQSALGKVIRLNADGSVPADNPFQDKGELAKSFYSIGHRNPLGIAFDAKGRLWSSEMGPRHGDELNLIEAGRNYGWPIVSEGNHYSGQKIPNHAARPEFAAPKAAWVPSIAPAGLVLYKGAHFKDWRGDALIAGLKSEALIHVDINGTRAKESERFEWGKRIRDVEAAPDGTIWVIEDRNGGRLIRLRLP